MKQAETEHKHEAVAYCPECDKEHDVSTCGDGQIECCGIIFYWKTVD